MSLLLADIGGTNARFAFKRKEDDSISYITYLKCSDFQNIHSAIKFYQEQNNLNIENMSLAVASTTKQDEIKFTNNDWSFKQTELLDYFDLNKLLLINDFVAQSLCFGTFYKKLSSNVDYNNKLAVKHNLKLIKSGNPILKAPLLITGPGTGLGVCTLCINNQNLIAIEGEGGHASFAPNSDLEIRLLQFLRKKHNHVSFERIVSVSGIEEIYNFVLYEGQVKSEQIKSPEIGSRALIGEINAVKTVEIMFAILGTVISNMILINGTQSGVIITGGITPKLKLLLPQSDFEKNLLNKGRRHEYIKNVPIWLTEDNNNGLIGALNAFTNKNYSIKILSKK